MRPIVDIRRYPLLFLTVLLSFCLAWSKSAVSVLLTIIAAALALRAALQPGFRRAAAKELLQPLTVPFLLMLGVSLVGVLYTETMSNGMAVVNKVLTLPLVYMAITVVLRTPPSEEESRRSGDAVLFAFMAGVLVLDVIGFLTFLGLIGQKAYVLPLAPLHVHHIWFSNLNALGLYAAVSFFLDERMKERTSEQAFLAVYAAFSIVAIVMSQSRTAWLGVLATGTVLAVLFSKRKKTLVAAGAAVLLGGLLAYQFSPLVKERIEAARKDVALYASGDVAKETSMGDRFLMWEAALRMFRSHPFGGVGTGDYGVTLESYVRAGSFPVRLLKYNQPHNLFLFTLATTGLAGFLALLYLFSRIFRHALPERAVPGIRQQYAFVALATAVHFLIAGLFDSFFNIFVLRYAFAVMMAVTVRHLSENPLITKH